MNELIGTNLGPYQLTEKIGQGGMAPIFKAYQPSLDRFVAIKVLLPSFAAKSADFVKRFEREAKSIARLHHPNILPVYDFGADRDYYYIVMQYVESAQTLTHLVFDRPPIERAIDLISQVAGALAYAHKNGVIHRDVKPSNILLDEGWALLSDFGLAKVAESATRLTESGKGIGTPAYMSPEQAQGEEIDQRSDIYALGVVLYELLTGGIPHDAPTPWGILMRRTTQPAPSPRILNPAVSESVAQVVLRALAADPAHRYNSATDFSLALKKAAADDSYREPLIGPDNRRVQDFVLAAEPLALSKPPPQETRIFTPPPAPLRPSQADGANENSPRFWRNSLWPIVASISIAIGTLGLWSSNAFGWASPWPKPSETAPAIAIAPWPTHTPTFSPSPTPANTATPTQTPAPPTATPTNTPLPPPTATPTQTVAPPTATPTNPPPTMTIPAAALPTATPTPAVPTGVIRLLKPLSLDEPSYGPTDFEWEWSGDMPPDFGFEVRVWREGEPPAGVHNAVDDNQNGRIVRVGENQYRLSVDIKNAAGVRDRSGQYLWTVVVVRISPNYADMSQQAEPAHLRFEAGGNGGGGGKEDGGSSGTIS